MTILLIFVGSVVIAEVGDSDQNKKIAVIGQHAIQYREISVSESARTAIEKQYARKAEVRDKINGLETRKLSRLLRRKLASHKIEELKITVSAKAVNNAVDKHFNRAGINEREARKIAQRGNRLVSALKAVHLKGKESANVYEQHLLDSSVSRKEWKIYKKQYRTKQQIRHLQEMLPGSLEEMKDQSQASKRKDLLMRKLQQEVAPIEITVKEVREFYLEKYSRISKEKRPQFQEVRSDLRENLRMQKASDAMDTWYREEAAKRGVEILDKQFQLEWLKAQ